MREPIPPFVPVERDSSVECASVEMDSALQGMLRFQRNGRKVRLVVERYLRQPITITINREILDWLKLEADMALAAAPEESKAAF